MNTLVVYLYPFELLRTNLIFLYNKWGVEFSVEYLVHGYCDVIFSCMPLLFN